MTHDKVWEKFKERNGLVSDLVTCWFPNGRNSIRVRLRDGDLIFTYISKKKWKLETVDSYLDSNKTEVKR